jgi:hypothetical protein
MRFTLQLLVLVSSPWTMIRDAVNAELHHSLEQEEKDLSVIIISSAHHQDEQHQRDLQTACPAGEHWNGAIAQCIAVNCDSAMACTGFDQTCVDTMKICATPGAICPQFTCKSSCPPYEQKDPVTGQCIPVYCSSPNACPASMGKICLRIPADNCQAGRPCPQFKCCEDTSRCSALKCAYGRLNGPDGCPTCDCKPCYGYFGMSGHGYVGGGGGMAVSTFSLHKLHSRWKSLDERAYTDSTFLF